MNVCSFYQVISQDLYVYNKPEIRAFINLFSLLTALLLHTLYYLLWLGGASVPQRLTFSWGLEKQATYDACVSGAWGFHTLSCSWAKSWRLWRSFQVGTEVPLVCGSVPSECSFSPRHASGDDEHWGQSTGWGRARWPRASFILEVLALHQAGQHRACGADGHSAGAASMEAVAVLEGRCWGGIPRGGIEVTHSVCPSLHPPPLVTVSSFSKSVSVLSVSPSGSDVSDTRWCLSSSVWLHLVWWSPGPFILGQMALCLSV